jgi:hypothetical protein
MANETRRADALKRGSGRLEDGRGSHEEEDLPLSQRHHKMIYW